MAEEHRLAVYGRRRTQTCSLWQKKNTDLQSMAEEEHRLVVYGRRRTQTCSLWQKKNADLQSMAEEEYNC